MNVVNKLLIWLHERPTRIRIPLQVVFTLLALCMYPVLLFTLYVHVVAEYLDDDNKGWGDLLPGLVLSPFIAAIIIFVGIGTSIIGKDRHFWADGLK